MAKCPADDLNGFDPCPVCGALGPWYDSPPLGDCRRVVDTGDELHQILGEALRTHSPSPHEREANPDE